MKKTYNIFSFVLLLLITGTGLVSCSDDKLELPGDPEITIGGESDFDGYSLNFTATLDCMGGESGSRGISDEKLAEMENFIDLEKFRVLFFTCEFKNGKSTGRDRFLFESKSRRVRNMGGNKWLISVPLYTSGNDIYEDRTPKEYNWKAIRDYLTTDSFKIAILANRPEEDYYPGYDSQEGGLGSDFFENRSPFWYPEHSVASGKDTTKVMDVFDIHHAQYDPIYKNKSYVTDSDLGFYSSIMADDEDGWTLANYKNSKWQPTLSSTSSWIETDESKNLHYLKDKGTDTRRFTVLPSLEHPIPMYGIQRYDKIPKEYWKEGTPFNICSEIQDGLSISSYTGKPVSLLRSVVRVDLYLPQTLGKPKFVGIAYTNVNARCEPMDVWTPTDELWKRQHSGTGMLKDNITCVEYNAIQKYGPISTSTPPDGNTVQQFQKQIGWFYGCWLEKKWDFGNTTIKNHITDKVKNFSPAPRIFNPCTQRNNMIILDWTEAPDGYENNSVGNVTTEDEKEYFHYVAYIGERNINDPSKLNNLTAAGAGNSTISYWVIENKGNMYAFPFVDYDKSDALEYINATKASYAASYDRNSTLTSGFKAEYNSQITPYSDRVLKSEYKDNPEKYPYPLIRNHVYKFTFKKKESRSNTNLSECTVISGDYHSKTL